MKRLFLITGILLMMSLASINAQEIYSDDTLFIYTDTLAKDVYGYNGNIPLRITIVDNIITNIEALPNNETPRFFKRVEENLLPSWNGMSVKKALHSDVDVVSGATYSSQAVIESVKRGLVYAQSLESHSNDDNGKDTSSVFIYIIAIVAICIIITFIVFRIRKSKSK
ncbi:MAG: FMN-binding protein [Bacteroidales bacterium]|nr:FMN-binding protein [Bacteroidales bacterium]MDD2204099.1 FMN-binding protein [Bacteroidales bacterium]MDD3153163.1 FMN-binding protein [Bacteroidales bacterium]MDD3913763.1 FMN-binding protein [Bacteroidales bacterium]MDD4633528.1 FMN-binding protein [Bacteroidales bacterium]